MEDLAELAASVTGFAAREHLTIVPAVPTNDCGPEVFLGPGELDLPGFLELAGRLGGGVLYLQAVPFDPGIGEDQPVCPPARQLGHKGQTGQVSVAFAANGVVHFWEHETDWYLEWEELDGRASRRFPGMDEADVTERLGQEERAQLAGELADAILADPQFRAARTVNRQRIARQTIPKGADQWAAWDAIRQACDRANQMAQEQYDQLEDRLDGLAAELLASSAYLQASSAAARRQAAERFLISHADGFSPPAPVRDELYAQARDLAKTAAKGSASGLFLMLRSVPPLGG
jgi:hypothetical protein